MKPGSWSLILLIGALFGAMFYVYFWPERNLGPAQPVSFSHRVHAGVKGSTVASAIPGWNVPHNAGLPAVEKCFYLPQVHHSEPSGNTERGAVLEVGHTRSLGPGLLGTGFRIL